MSTRPNPATTRMTRLPDPRERPWLTVKELAQITGDGEKVIRKAISDGTIPHLEIGRYVRIPTAALHQLLGIERGRDVVASGEPDATVHPLNHPGLTA